MQDIVEQAFACMHSIATRDEVSKVVENQQGRQERGGWGGPSRPAYCGKICH